MRGGKKEYNNQRWLMGYGEGKRRGEEIAMMIAVGTASMTAMYCRTAAPAVDASLVLLLLACLTPEATNVVA
jgi:hypothetical protein